MAAKVILSGMPDHLVIRGSTALVLDYKTGRGEVTPSERNLQMMALAVLVKANHKRVSKVYVAIVQPHRDPEMVCYTGKKLKEARAFIESIISLALMPLTHRVAGEKQCRWCKFKSECPEAIAATLTITNSGGNGLTDPARFAQLLDYIGVAKKMIPTIEAKAREALEANPDAIEGYMLKDGVRRREVEDVEDAFNALKADGLIDEVSFMSACRVSLTSLAFAVHVIKGMSKSAAKESIARSLGDLVNESEGQPRLHKYE
jgi:hypothetical protein